MGRPNDAPATMRRCQTAVLPAALWLACLAVTTAAATADTLKVMTFNTWQCGWNVDDGLNKIADHVRAVDPDIVCFQELEAGDCWQKMSSALGGAYAGVHNALHAYPDTGFFTKWHIYDGDKPADSVVAAVGAKVLFPLLSSPDYHFVNVSVWCGHLDYHSYGPYAACNKLCDDPAQIMAGELNLGSDMAGRVQNVAELVAHPSFAAAVAAADREPLLLMGDFNAPSHLDWVDAAKEEHCGWAFEWPTTKRLAAINMTDSFRQVNPDVRKDPGHTWSAAYRFQTDFGQLQPEPLDRIDFVYYKGGRLRPVVSHTYAGEAEVLEAEPTHKCNTWPSDHRAVVTVFEVAE